MSHDSYNGRKVIWSSKTRQVAVIAICFLFVAAVVWTRQDMSTFSSWGGIVFFGGIGIFMLIQLLHPKNLFVLPDSPLGQKIQAGMQANTKAKGGFLTLNETGFGLWIGESETHCKWVDIQTIFAYKEDRMTTDAIYLDIFTRDEEYIRIWEATPGWSVFIEYLHKHIPSVRADWESEVVHPPFATNLTLIFDAQERSQSEAITFWYGDQG